MIGVLDTFGLGGRRALVTGAGRGLGAAMARGLAEAGASVALVSRSADQVAATAAAIGDRGFALPADVSDPETFPALVDRAEERLGGPIDIVLHAAGVQHRQPAVDFDRPAWDALIAVNLSAPFFLSQEIGRRQLGAGRPGSHIFVASLGSHIGLRDVVAYTAGKSGLWAVVRNLAVEWSAHGIRANAIGPGYIRTELTKALLDDPDSHRRILARVPMGRLGTPDDMAGAAVFLASDASAYVTGQLLMVDGGWTAG
ncbi:MAG TPA: SDR family oxidoreductase [Amycolatopsis sp.]|nr:SDR family oxidoreductase [Amycolatopsis sp.]